MRIEHFALQLEDPAAAAQWYCRYLGWTIKMGGEAPAFAHFVADGSGQVMLEIYKNLNGSAPDYRVMHPMQLHIAMTADDLVAVRDRLVAGGAKLEQDVTTLGNGDQILMVRDPWGLPLQFVKRLKSII